MASPLPMREGVTASRVNLPNGPWKTIGDYFSVRFPQVTRDSWQRRVNQGELVDEKGQLIRLENDYRCGACIYYYRERAVEIPIPLQETILFQNEELLVVDKPHFLPVTPGGRFLQETLRQPPVFFRVLQWIFLDTTLPVLLKYRSFWFSVVIW